MGPFFAALWLVLFSGISPNQPAVSDDTVLATSASTAAAAASSLPPPSVTLRAAPQSRRFDAVVVDVENLRGRSGFCLSHARALEALRLWNPFADGGRLTLVVDHGREASRYWLPEAGYAVAFAGPHCKADDVVALDLVPFLCQQRRDAVVKIQVVTADAELIRRCRHAAAAAATVDDSSRSGGGGSSPRLEILSPDALLCDLEKILEAHPIMDDGDDDEDDDNTPDEPSGLVDEYELKLGESSWKLRHCCASKPE